MTDATTTSDFLVDPEQRITGLPAAEGPARPSGQQSYAAATDTLEHAGRGLQEGSPPFVYAIGQVESHFPSLAVEQEFAQVVGLYDTKGKTDQEVRYMVLSKRENRYLARQMCWLFSIENLPTYIVVPRDPVDLELLTEAVRDSPGTDADLEVLIGLLGPLAPPEACGGLVLPMVAFDHLYSFQRDELIAAIPAPEGMTETDEQFRRGAAELLQRLMQIADNAGATDEHRALNYLAVRYPAIYSNALEASRDEKSLSAVEVRTSRLAGSQNIVDVIFSYTHRRTDVLDRYFVRVDVTGEFPFLVSRLQHFYER